MNDISILVVDDEQGYREEICEYLQNHGFISFAAERPDQALRLLKSQTVDIAILDLSLPGMDGIELMREIHTLDPDTGVIMISGHGDMESVISAMREGALDFFPKPFKLLDIRCAIERTRKYIELQNRLEDAQTQCQNLFSIINRNRSFPIIGPSKIMNGIIHLIGQICQNLNTDVLISGDSGTGKELVARAIHRLGAGNDSVFFDVNCTAIPETLFESEFFGHSRNAFTGATTEKKGWFEIANHGTLFLDEIGDLPLTMQAKLLRVLEERRIRKVGSSKDIHLDLRVIASTNRDLHQLIANKQFREDLYYRLNRFSIHIPPLRERMEDIPPLIEHYNAHFAQLLNKSLKPISLKAMKLLTRYKFPGNVRELRNIIEKANILCDPADDELRLDCFPDLAPVSSFVQMASEEEDLDLGRLDDMEIAMIKRAIHKAENNRSKAAQLLNISRMSLSRRIEKYKLDI